MREGDAVILCLCGPVDGFIKASLETIDRVGRGFVLVKGKLFPTDVPWELVSGPSPIQCVLQPDTPENRSFYGITADCRQS